MTSNVSNRKCTKYISFSNTIFYRHLKNNNLCISGLIWTRTTGNTKMPRDISRDIITHKLFGPRFFGSSMILYITLDSIPRNSRITHSCTPNIIEHLTWEIYNVFTSYIPSGFTHLQMRVTETSPTRMRCVVV